jgi:acetylornithine deacetylase
VTTVDDGTLAAAAQGDPVALARALVRIPSVNPLLEVGGAGEEKIARQCGAWLEAWGFKVSVDEVAPGRFNTVGWVGSDDGPGLLLNGHLDTVGVEGMSVPPFDARVQDGRLWGRGACDMKGGVAALLAAGARLAREPDLGGRLTVALTADEEHASLGMQALLRSGTEADVAVVCEPTELAVMPANKGFVWIELEFTGRAAHGSRPDVGIDAIRHAAQYLAGLDGYEVRLKQRPAHPLLGHGSFHAGSITGGSAPSVYPASCTLVIERRTLPGESAEAVISEFEAMLDGVKRAFPEMRARLAPGLDRPGTEVPSDAQLVQGLLRASSDVGLEPRIEGMSAWVDAALLNEASVPAVCFGPGSISQAHAADEWIAVVEIEQAARVLYRFAREFLAPVGPRDR